jgi:hypothetical protein
VHVGRAEVEARPDASFDDLRERELIPASAAVRFCIAKRRALSTMSTSYRPTRSRATAFQVAMGVVCHQRAMYVCAGVRTAPLTAPSALVSLTSAA